MTTSTAVLGLGREAADDVVGLVPSGPDDGEVERGEDLADHRDLRLEGVGRLLDVGTGRHDLGHAVRLVARDQLDAPVRPPVVVPAGDEVRRLVVVHQPGDDVEQPAHRVDGVPSARRSESGTP